MMTTDASERSWFVYVLRNPDGKIYIGQTDNVPHRLYQHNDPTHTLTRTTKRFRGPWQLGLLRSRDIPLRCVKSRKSTKVWPRQSLA